MPNIKFEDFIWFDLGPKPPAMTINVSETGGFTFNRPAREVLPSHIKIGIKPDGKTVCVVEDPASRYTLPKSGKICGPELVKHIISAGIVLPARYAMRKEDNCWIAELQAPAPKKRPPAKNPRRISKSAEDSILKELKDGKRR